MYSLSQQSRKFSWLYLRAFTYALPEFSLQQESATIANHHHIPTWFFIPLTTSSFPPLPSRMDAVHQRTHRCRGTREFTEMVAAVYASPCEATGDEEALAMDRESRGMSYGESKTFIW